MNRSHILLIALSMSLSGSLVACGGAEPNAEDEETMDELRGKTLTLTDADDGKTLTVETGKTVKVKLSANATTGYAWRVKSVDRTLGQPTISYKAGGGAVGSGGVTTLTWKLTSPLDLVGTHKVQLEYQRPWSETAPPAKTFSFTLKVVKAGTPAFCSDGTIHSEPSYVSSADGKECSLPKLHCVTKAFGACPMLSPPSPNFCKDGTIVSEDHFISSSDGKECWIPRLHCVTKDRNACPFLSPLHPNFCKDGTIESGRSFIASADGKECSMPSVHCLTKDALSCPMR